MVAYALTQGLFVKRTVMKFAWASGTNVMVTMIATTTLMKCPGNAMIAHPLNFLSVLWTAKRYALQMAASVMVLYNAPQTSLLAMMALRGKKMFHSVSSQS